MLYSFSRYVPETYEEVAQNIVAEVLASVRFLSGRSGGLDSIHGSGRIVVVTAARIVALFPADPHPSACDCQQAVAGEDGGAPRAASWQNR